jgi:hypothetical protein
MYIKALSGHNAVQVLKMFDFNKDYALRHCETTFYYAYDLYKINKSFSLLRMMATYRLIFNQISE